MRRFVCLIVAGIGLWAGAAPSISAKPRSDGAYIASIPPVIPNPPPLSPSGEAVVPNDPAFRTACLDLIPALVVNIRLGREITTETKHWGIVLRIDFSMRSVEMQTIAGRINRLVFWRGAGGTPFVLIAVGQPLPPLPP